LDWNGGLSPFNRLFSLKWPIGNKKITGQQNLLEKIFGKRPGACTMMVVNKLRVAGLVSSRQNQTNPTRRCWYHDADHQLSLSTQALILSLGVTSVVNSQSHAEKE